MLMVILGIVFVLACFYYLFLKPLSFWSNHGVKQPSPLVHMYYNWFVLLQRQSAAHLVQKMYKACPSARYYGIHQFNMPSLILKDPELIKQIAIKDFDHFTDRRFTLPDNIDPLWHRSLLALKGEKWREMRSLLSPTFTGRKMKLLFQLMTECAEKFVQHFLDKDQDIVVIEMQDTFTRFCNDVIATSVFGVEVDSLAEPDNEFYLRGRDATDLTTLSKGLKYIASLMVPRLYKLLNIRFFDATTINLYERIIQDSIKLREEKGIIRPDMIHLLMEARKEIKKEEYDDTASPGPEEVEGLKRVDGKVSKIITNEDITAQALTFFFAGFESVSRLMCFMAHELAVNQDVQDKLREEIKENALKCHGKLTYDILVNMKYMDMVLSEVLRKYPTQVATDRVCTKPYTIEPSTPEEKPVHLSTGVSVIIPTYAMHHDPEFYPEPERFNPERFSEENKGSLNPYVYQPFGLGPRNCIGSRFALLETKTVFFHILLNFQIVPVEKTTIPLVLLRSAFSLSAEGGFWLGLKSIKK